MSFFSRNDLTKGHHLVFPFQPLLPPTHSSHEGHAVHLWDVWEVVQTQHVFEGSLAPAFWREALPLWGKTHTRYEVLYPEWAADVTTWLHRLDCIISEKEMKWSVVSFGEVGCPSVHRSVYTVIPVSNILSKQLRPSHTNEELSVIVMFFPPSYT